MNLDPKKSPRRKFLKESALLSAGFTLSPLFGNSSSTKYSEDKIYLIGPLEGYAPNIGTLLSTMNMMRYWVVNTAKDLNQEQLDFQLDDKSNSIGAMLLHLAAVERYYQLNTFDEIEMGSWSDEIKKEWDTANNLGQAGRDQIKGNNIDYYLSKLGEVREVTKTEFAKRDDDWLMKQGPFFGGRPTNNHAKWFHVCEHESNHNGQIKLIKGRLPS